MFENKVVIITGGAGGIGSGITKMFINEKAKVVINDLSEDKLTQFIEDTPSESRKYLDTYKADVRNSESIDNMVAYTKNTYGSIDVLVNAAGFGLIAPSITDISDESWELVVGVNLKGAFNTCRAVTPIMKEKGTGRIINISSLAGRTKSVIAGAHYTSAKAGLIGLTKHLAYELIEEDNITVNAICPGVTDTPLVRGQKTQAELDAITSGIPKGRLCTTDELAKAVKYLADFGNSYMTGISLDINGGLYMN